MKHSAKLSALERQLAKLPPRWPVRTGGCADGSPPPSDEEVAEAAAALDRGESRFGLDPGAWREFMADLEKQFTPNAELL